MKNLYFMPYNYQLLKTGYLSLFLQHFRRLQQHILYKHTVEKPFKCTKCDFAHALARGLKGIVYILGHQALTFKFSSFRI